MTEPCIKRRMLFACRQAYEKAGWQPPVDEQVGWVSPQVFTADDALHEGHIDCAWLGRIPEGILLAFRGTLPPTDAADSKITVFLDWANDANLLPLQLKTYPGRVHAGFHHSLEQLWPAIKPAIQSLLAQDPARNQLFITGHSKGGALANLAAWRALTDIPGLASPIHVVTIAGARAGDIAFHNAYEAHGAIHSMRYESAFDLVPLLPFGADTPAWAKAIARLVWANMPDFGYVSVGQRMLARVSWAEAVGAMRRYLRWLGIGGSRTGYEPLVVQAHGIGKGSDYDTLVCVGETPGCSHQLN